MKIARRGLRHPKLLVAAIVGVVVLALPTMVMARALSDIFTDVPTANPFHNDINAIRNAGITKRLQPADERPVLPQREREP